LQKCVGGRKIKVSQLVGPAGLRETDIMARTGWAWNPQTTTGIRRA